MLRVSSVDRSYVVRSWSGSLLTSPGMLRGFKGCITVDSSDILNMSAIFKLFLSYV